MALAYWPEEQSVGLAASAAAVVAAMVPDPVVDKLPPVPRTMAAVVFVPLVIALKADEPPPPPACRVHVFVAVHPYRFCPAVSSLLKY